MVTTPKSIKVIGNPSSFAKDHEDGHGTVRITRSTPQSLKKRSWFSPTTSKQRCGAALKSDSLFADFELQSVSSEETTKRQKKSVNEHTGISSKATKLDKLNASKSIKPKCLTTKSKKGIEATTIKVTDASKQHRSITSKKQDLSLEPNTAKATKSTESKPTLFPNTNDSPKASKQRTRWIHPMYLPVNQGINVLHASAELGRQGKTADTAEDMLRTMRNDRHKVFDFANQQLESRIVQYCIDHDYTYKEWNEDEVIERQIRSFANVCKSWREDGSEENAARMWNCMFGQFDLMERWEYKLEAEFMNINGWKYLDADDETDIQHRKTCIARVIRQAKVNLVKRLNVYSIRTHRGMIGLKRKNYSVKQTHPDFKPRKKGCFDYHSFVTKAVCRWYILTCKIIYLS
jgi:hypothetical protein